MNLINVGVMITLLAAAAQAQGPAAFVAATGAITLSATGTSATLRQPATAGEAIAIDSVTITCPALCIATQVQNSTSVSGSTGTIQGITPNQSAKFTSNFYTAATVSGGTTAGPPVVCTAGCTFTLVNPVQGQPIVTLGAGAGLTGNYTITISSVTGDVYITFTGRRL